MFDDEPATLLAALVTVLTLPCKVPMQSWRRRAEAVRHGDHARSMAAVAALWIAFVPLILLYEAFAVPLVAGSTVIALLLIVPAGLIGACWVAMARVLRRPRAGESRLASGSPVMAPAVTAMAGPARPD